MKTIVAMPGAPIEIGRTGENKAVKVVFQGILDKWKELYGEGLVSMVYKRPKDKYSYPVVCLIENDGADVSWVVSRTDLKNSGLGKLELVYTVNETVAISETYPVMIKRSISGESGSEPPEDPGKTWFEDMNDRVDSLEKREMIVTLSQVYDENGRSTWQANHTFEEIKNACMDPQTLVSVQALTHNPKTGVIQDRQNGNAIYFSSRNMIEFTWVYPPSSSGNFPVTGFKMHPDESITLVAAMLELSSYKDTNRIGDPTSTTRYPSNKAMTNYVNSQILAGKEIFVVNWTESPEVCQADKTYAEIKAALENDVVTVVGKTENDGKTYATHEITIATDGKIYFRFVWYDETRGTMEKYFWLQEDESSSSTSPHPVSQQDWAENDEQSAAYVKNRPGAYTVQHNDVIKANAKDFPTPVISLTHSYIQENVYFGIIFMRENIDGLESALKNGTVESSDNLTWVSGENYYYTNEVFSTAKNEWFPKCVVILKENTTVKGIKFPKIGIYTTGVDSFGNGWAEYDSKFYISWTRYWFEDVKIPLKYQEKETFFCAFTATDGGVIECDKTFEELNEAFNAGKNVVGVIHDSNMLPIYTTPIVSINPTENLLIFTFRVFMEGANVQATKIAVTPDGCKKLGLLADSPANIMEPVYCSFAFDISTKAYECDIDYSTIRKVASMGLPVIGSILGSFAYFVPGHSCFVIIAPNEAKDSLGAGFLVYNSTSKKWDMSDPISLSGSSNSELFIITEKSGGGQGYSNSSASYTEMLAAMDAGQIPVLFIDSTYYYLGSVDRDNNKAHFYVVTFSSGIDGVRLICRTLWESKISDLSNTPPYDAYSPMMKDGYRQNGYIANGTMDIKNTPVYLYIDEDKADGSDSPVYPLTKIVNSSHKDRQYGGIQYIESANGHKFVYRQFTFKSGNNGNMDMKEWQFPEPSAKTDEQTQEVGIDTATGKLYTKPAPNQITPVFYIDLAGMYPNFTCETAMADIAAAYNAGQELRCRCTIGDYTAVLPLFVPLPSTNTWLFSGSGALDELAFPAQSLTIGIVNGAVYASNIPLAKKDDIPTVPTELKNPEALTIKTSSGTVTYDGSEAKTVEVKNGMKGDTGATPNIQIGIVTTLDTGEDATASMTGTPEKPLLNLGIPNGANGKTPVRGTDYWTDEDKKEIVQSVLAELPDGTEVSY